MNTLIIEDDKSLANLLLEILPNNKKSKTTTLGEKGVKLARSQNFDLIIIDLTLPDSNGIDICQSIRKYCPKIPILILSGDSEPQSKVNALDSGADDYLTKPFNRAELLARIRALSRRSAQYKSKDLSFKDLILNIDSRTVFRNSQPIKLRRKEFDLLEYLIRNKNQVSSREMILNKVWRNRSNPTTNTVDVHIKWLRDKIDKPFDQSLIHTIHGIGYKLSA